MKTLIAFLLLPFSAFCHPAERVSGTLPAETNAFQSALRSQITELVDVPDFIHENDLRNDYKAVVCIKPDGSIFPESSNCINAELKSYVEEELRRIRLRQNVPPEDTRIFLIIRFKVF
jgi:hypothetical protein